MCLYVFVFFPPHMCKPDQLLVCISVCTRIYSDVEENGYKHELTCACLLGYVLSAVVGCATW